MSNEPNAHKDDQHYRRKYPLRENWVAVVFMLGLLLIAGVTASVAGYRIKLADRDRKDQLMNTYLALGGTREALIIPEETVIKAPRSSPQYIFLAAYELNVRSLSLIAPSTKRPLFKRSGELANMPLVCAGQTDMTRGYTRFRISMN